MILLGKDFWEAATSLGTGKTFKRVSFSLIYFHPCYHASLSCSLLFYSFQNPIENGQHTNSTVEDVKIMNQRSHILYEQLKGFVQRMDTSVVKKDLPPKTVFVIAVKLSPLQRQLYKRFLDVHGFTKDKSSGEKIFRSFFAGYQALAQVCTQLFNYLPPDFLGTSICRISFLGEKTITIGLYSYVELNLF